MKTIKIKSNEIIEIDFSGADWNFTVAYALAHLFFPLFVILSKVIKKKIVICC